MSALHWHCDHNGSTLDCCEQLFVAGTATGGCVSHFDRVHCMHWAPHTGVWLSALHSSLVQLWCARTFTCLLLYDITGDHAVTKASGDEASDTEMSSPPNAVQITALLCHDGQLWVGTQDGYLIIYEVIPLQPSAAHPTERKCGFAFGTRSLQHRL